MYGRPLVGPDGERTQPSRSNAPQSTSLREKMTAKLLICSPHVFVSLNRFVKSMFSVLFRAGLLLFPTVQVQLFERVIYQLASRQAAVLVRASTPTLGLRQPRLA